MLTRLHTKKQIEWSPAARSRFEIQKRDLINRNKHRDTHWAYDDNGDGEFSFFFRDEVLVYSKKQGEKPWYTSGCTMHTMDCFMLGWIPRYLLQKNTKEVDYEIVKYIAK